MGHEYKIVGELPTLDEFLASLLYRESSGGDRPTVRLTVDDGEGGVIENDYLIDSIKRASMSGNAFGFTGQAPGVGVGGLFDIEGLCNFATGHGHLNVVDRIRSIPVGFG